MMADGTNYVDGRSLVGMVCVRRRSRSGRVAAVSGRVVGRLTKYEYLVEWYREWTWDSVSQVYRTSDADKIGWAGIEQPGESRFWMFFSDVRDLYRVMGDTRLVAGDPWNIES